MRPLSPAILLLSAIAIASPSSAKGPPATPSATQATNDLRKALEAIGQSLASPEGQANRPADPDQGDDHASPIAIDRVCSHDNPSADRSAICTPISPD